MPHFEKPKNALLTALPEKTLRNLFPKFERFDLVFGECVYDPGDVLTDVYFVESGMVSMLTVIDEHSALEVSMVGSEGMVDLPVFLGITASKTGPSFKGAGIALRMKVADFLEECGYATTYRGSCGCLLIRYLCRYRGRPRVTAFTRWNRASHAGS